MFDPLIAAFGPNFDFKTGKDCTLASMMIIRELAKAHK